MTDFDSAAYRFIINVGLPILRVVTKRDWRGLEHVPTSGPCIVVPNHTSYFDPLSVGHFLIEGAKRRPRYLGKREVVEMPVLGKLFQAAGQITVHRNTTNAVNAYRDAIAALELGHCVTIYPEGTTTHDPDNWPMMGKTGAARLALATGAPLIPVAQWGAEQVMPNEDGFHLRLFPRKTMQVRAGQAVDIDDLRESPAVLVVERLLADVGLQPTMIDRRPMDAYFVMHMGTRGATAVAQKGDVFTARYFLAAADQELSGMSVPGF